MPAFLPAVDSAINATQLPTIYTTKWSAIGSANEYANRSAFGTAK